jgi:hypothetical protein
MTTLEFMKAKMIITNACNSTGIELPEVVGVLSAILEEAREQMSYELAENVFRLEEEKAHLLAEINKQKEADAENGDSE